MALVQGGEDHVQRADRLQIPVLRALPGTYRGASTPIAGSGVSWLDPLLSSGFVELAGPRLHGLMGVIFSEGELTQVR